MNDNLKNIFSFIKEAIELKNKNIYDISNYEINLDLKEFSEKYKELINDYNYSDITINNDNIVFKLKYMQDSKKKDYPKVPENLKEFIYLDIKNDIIEKIDNIVELLKEKGLLDEYNKYDQEIKEINKYNSMIDKYNSTYNNFYRVYKRIHDHEEKIEVILGTNLLFWKDRHENKLTRYILEANLDLTLDSINNIITFTINKEKFKGFVTDFLNYEPYKVKESISLYDFVKKINENIENNEETNLNEEIKKYINYISLENDIQDRYYLYNNETLKYNCTYLFNNVGIIVRNKNAKLWIDDLEKIIELCDTEKFDSPILNMFEVNLEDEIQVKEFLNDKNYDLTKDNKVLFPLPSNNEQYKIVDKVKSSNIVLVQGPPGTGKSHTIANLLSHYISEGKKVIVTSEKAKALEVLRNFLPEKIRSLSLALLTSNGIDKDLEYSIDTILKKQSDEEELKKIEEKIEYLNNKLTENNIKKIQVSRDIIEFMSKDTVSYKEELNNLMEYEFTNEFTLMDIAKWLDENKKYRKITIEDVENYSYTDVNEFFSKLDDISDLIKNNNYAISSSIPINNYLTDNELELYIKENIGYRNYLLKNPELVGSIKQSSLNEENVKKLKNKIETLAPLYKYFDKNWIKSNVNYEAFINNLKKIEELIIDNDELINNAEEKIFNFKIEFDLTNINDYQAILQNMLKLYDENANIGLLNKIKLNSYISKLDGLLLNGNNISKKDINKDILLILEEELKYYSLIELIKLKIEQVLEINLFDKLEITKSQFGKFKDKILGIIKGIINYILISNQINQIFEEIVNTKLFEFSYMDCDEEFINSVIKDLDYYVSINVNSQKTNSIIEEIRNFYKDYNLQNLDKLLISIETNDIDNFIINKNALLKEINTINQYHNLKKIYSSLVNDKENLIKNYIYDFNLDEKQFLKNNLDKIFKYHYVEKFYLSLENKNKELPILFEKREQLIQEEKEIIEELVAIKGWYFQSKGMNHNISSSLNRWINLKKKLGAMKGKNTNIYLRQMREEMEIAKNAIPVWIMPVDKLIEQYPFTNDPPFDVLIMDESSQSSVFAISALARAKKIIIVGDDKQISPTNAFTNIDTLNDLRNKYLKNNKWNLQISKDTSIYDIVQTLCGNKKITLTEHFRCLPEIINYSNKEFYNMQINPLKVRSKENTIELPIKTIYVPNAICKKNNSQIYNETEILRIISLIEEMTYDSQYDNKKIGIIVLQNSNRHIQKLVELLMQKFGEKFINDREIKVGTTYDFQGDQRDVIILSMIISSFDENGERYNFRSLTTKEFDKSFNVAASRAKEQMILVHSVKLEELSPICNRYKLLNYCLNYKNEKEQEFEKLFESSFERDIYNILTSKNIKLVPQFKIGNYRLDFMVSNDNSKKIAIECDGDRYHGLDELEYDIERQTILERCGWKFVRIRASEFYYNREESVDKLIKEINCYLDLHS